MALTAKAAAEGMLKDWRKQLPIGEPAAKAKFFSTEAVHPNEGNLDTQPISEVIAEIMKDVSSEELALLPKDGASHVDRYVYGLPCSMPMTALTSAWPRLMFH